MRPRRSARGGTIAAGRLVRVAAVLALACGVVSGPAAAPRELPGPGWITIEYGDLVDRRQPTHSGDSVGVLLDRLDGRSLPRDGERPGDRRDLGLLEPWLEPYAFVLPDALDASARRVDASAVPPLVEVAWLWGEGDAQPAWVELARSRRILVESDGRGRIRVCAPLAPEEIDMSSAAAGRRAWRRARPVVRHVLASERARLARAGREVELAIEVHPFVHHMAETTFVLGAAPYRVPRDETGPPADVPSFDRAAWQRFLDSGWALEGARLEEDGTIRFVGSERDAAPTLLGEPWTLADVAVLYRAVFHGGLVRPYVSLDRGYTPHAAIVNYGGRLRDTRVGDVVLRCDMRFKTFSVGVDRDGAVDVRDAVRASVPGFRTHYERMAVDPRSAGVRGQQTRFWFYPDAVDLTLSPQGDVLLIRTARMSAASERLDEGGRSSREREAPWTTATVADLNGAYGAYADAFPELGDLDRVVRWLSLFSWLKLARAEGLPVPDLDALLAETLPAYRTPRRLPQVLAFHALPPAGSGGSVTVFPRLDVAFALDRFHPRDGVPLSPRRRFERAVGALARGVAEERALLDSIASVDPASLDATRLDDIAYRAERLLMHRLVLGTLPEEDRAPLLARIEAGERLQTISVAIGGIDLGMDNAVRSARGRPLTLGGDFSSAARASVAPPPSVRDPRTPTASAPTRPGSRPVAAPPRAPESRRPEPGRPPRGAATPPSRTGPVEPARAAPPLPAHGLADGDARTRLASGSIERERGDDAVTTRVVTQRDAPEVRARTVRAARTTGFARVERGRKITYGFETFGASRRARVGRTAARSLDFATAAAAADDDDDAGRTALVRIDGAAAAPVVERDTVTLSVEPPSGDGVSGTLRRRDLHALLFGRARVGPGAGALRGLVPLPTPLRDGVDRILVRTAEAARTPPYHDGGSFAAAAPEEDAATFARAFRAWLSEDAAAPEIAVAATVGAVARAERDPVADRRAVLLLPPGAFPGARDVHDAIAEAWRSGGGQVVAALPENARRVPSLVVLATAEPPAAAARRVGAIVEDGRLRDRSLAIVAVGVPVRRDAPASWIRDGGLAALGIAEVPVALARAVPDTLRGLRSRLAGAGKGGVALRDLDAFLWYY